MSQIVNRKWIKQLDDTHRMLVLYDIVEEVYDITLQEMWVVSGQAEWIDGHSASCEEKDIEDTIAKVTDVNNFVLSQCFTLGNLGFDKDGLDSKYDIYSSDK